MGSTCTCTTCDNDGDDTRSKANANTDKRMVPSPKGIKGRTPTKPRKQNKKNSSNTIQMNHDNYGQNPASMYDNDQMPLLSIEADVDSPELPQDNEGQMHQIPANNNDHSTYLSENNKSSQDSNSNILHQMMNQDTLTMIANMPNLTPIPSDTEDNAGNASPFGNIPDTQIQMQHHSQSFIQNEPQYNMYNNNTIKQDNVPNRTVSPMNTSPMNVVDQDQQYQKPNLANLDVKAVMIDKYGLSYSVSDDSSLDENEQEEIKRRKTEQELVRNTSNKLLQRKESTDSQRNLISPANLNANDGLITSDVMDEMADDMKAELKSLVDQGMSLQSHHSITPNYPLNTSIYGTDDDTNISNDSIDEQNNILRPPRGSLFRPKSVDKWDDDAIEQQRDEMAKHMMHMVQTSNHLNFEDLAPQNVNFEDDDEDQSAE